MAGVQGGKRLVLAALSTILWTCLFQTALAEEHYELAYWQGATKSAGCGTGIFKQSSKVIATGDMPQGHLAVAPDCLCKVVYAEGAWQCADPAPTLGEEPLGATDMGLALMPKNMWETTLKSFKGAKRPRKALAVFAAASGTALTKQGRTYVFTATDDEEASIVVKQDKVRGLIGAATNQVSLQLIESTKMKNAPKSKCHNPVFDIPTGPFSADSVDVITVKYSPATESASVTEEWKGYKYQAGDWLLERTTDLLQLKDRRGVGILVGRKRGIPAFSVLPMGSYWKTIQMPLTRFDVPTILVPLDTSVKFNNGVSAFQFIHEEKSPKATHILEVKKSFKPKSTVSSGSSGSSSSGSPPGSPAGSRPGSSAGRRRSELLQPSEHAAFRLNAYGSYVMLAREFDFTNASQVKLLKTLKAQRQTVWMVMPRDEDSKADGTPRSGMGSDGYDDEGAQLMWIQRGVTSSWKAPMKLYWPAGKGESTKALAGNVFATNINGSEGIVNAICATTAEVGALTDAAPGALALPLDRIQKEVGDGTRIALLTDDQGAAQQAIAVGIPVVGWEQVTAALPNEEI